MPLPSEVTCCCVSVYEDALTYGRKYAIIGANEDNLRVENDAGRRGWYPRYCFELSGGDVPRLASFHLDDPLPAEIPVDVSMELADGSKRWCWFATPRMLERCGDHVPGTEVHMHYCGHMIILSEISEQLIEAALRHLERQGELLDYTVPYNPVE
jgi:hypothetical protein